MWEDIHSVSEILLLCLSTFPASSVSIRVYLLPFSPCTVWSLSSCVHEPQFHGSSERTDDRSIIDRGCLTCPAPWPRKETAAGRELTLLGTDSVPDTHSTGLLSFALHNKSASEIDSIITLISYMKNQAQTSKTLCWVKEASPKDHVPYDSIYVKRPAQANP